MTSQEQAAQELPVLTTQMATPSIKPIIAIADSLESEIVGAKIADRKVASVNSLLRSLPTPSRSRMQPPRAALPSSSPTNGTSRGPEPWDLPNPEASSQSSSYRELLQLRGQQAMQRSRVRDIAPTPAPATPARLAPIMEVPNPALGTNTSCSAPLMMPPNAWLPLQQAWFVDGAVPQQQAVHQMQAPCPVEQLCGAGASGSGQHMPVITVPCNAGCQYSPPVTPQASAAASSCSSPWSPQEMMTTLMGSGAFDEQQIAEALRAAAPCEYED